MAATIFPQAAEAMEWLMSLPPKRKPSCCPCELLIQLPIAHGSCLSLQGLPSTPPPMWTFVAGIHSVCGDWLVRPTLSWIWVDTAMALFYCADLKAQDTKSRGPGDKLRCKVHCQYYCMELAYTDEILITLADKKWRQRNREGTCCTLPPEYIYTNFPWN